MLLSQNQKRSYFVARTLTTASSLIFAFIYSKELGLNNRSLITFVMATNVFIWVLVTSGTTLTLRKILLVNLDPHRRKSFNSLITIEIIFALFLFISTLEVYSFFKNYLPTNYILSSAIYFLLSGFHLIIVEALLASNKFRFSGLSDISTILLQIFFFFTLKASAGLSISVRLLISFSFSYLIVALVGLFFIQKNGGLTIGFTNPRIFFNETSGNHTIGTVLGIVDRLDRIIITWFFPTILLGQYAAMSGLISFFRFIPDSLSKIIVSSKSAVWRTYLKKPIVLMISLACLGVLMIYSSQLLIFHILGPEWLLPWGVSLIFALQELARGAFQVKGNHNVSVGNSHKTHRASKILLLTACPLAILFSQLFGIFGVPLGFLFSYIFLLLFMRKEEELV